MVQKFFLTDLCQIVEKGFISGTLGTIQEQLIIFHVRIYDFAHHIDFGILP